MEIERRNLLRIAASSVAIPLFPIISRASASKNFYFAARATQAGGHRVSGFTTSGHLVTDFRLPARGHSLAVHPEEPVIVQFARRPGRFAAVIDYAHQSLETWITPPDDRHFYGHGIYSQDGRILYATENDFNNQRGVVGIYDVQNGYKRFGEIDSYGIEPHDIRLLSDNETLVIANGGILTRPDLPRIKLNLPTMSPSLCYVNRHNGDLVAEKRLNSELRQLSIRHLSVTQDDTVGIAMQYEGPAGKLVPLVAIHRPVPSNSGDSDQNQLQLLTAPDNALRAMRRYCGSICIDATRQIIAVSAPRGNLIAFWDLATTHYLTSVEVFDSSGVALADESGSIIATSGNGEIVMIDPISRTVTPIHQRFSYGDLGSWDNHLVVASAG